MKPPSRFADRNTCGSLDARSRPGLDAVTLAILQGRLEQVVDEMDATLYRSAFNPTIAEAHDACQGIYDASSGDTLVQGTSGLPIFVGSMSYAVRAVMAAIAEDGVGPDVGDVFVTNDPYAGGTHLNDLKLVRPYFHEGQLFCYLASVAHWSDVGGNVPGNYNPAARESHQEGVLVPPMKLVERGARRPDVVRLLKAIGRSPMNAYGDLSAQLAALELGSQRMDELLRDHGAATIAEAFARLSDAAEALMRAQIEELPEGVYRAADHLDDDGSGSGPLRVAVALTVKAGRLELDFTDSAGACRGPLNIARSTTVAACYVALKHLFPEVPANAGCLRPIDFAIAPGSLLDAQPPRPVGGYTETILRVMDVIFAAVAQAAPERAMGCSYGTINAVSLAQRSGEEQSPWVMFTFFGGGLGGTPEGDGLNHGSAPLSTAVIPPVEIFEASYPLLFTRWSLRPDSGGPGLHRGGLGAIYELELRSESAELFVFGERAAHAPRGVAGGGSGARNVVSYRQAGAWQRPAADSAKLTGIELRRGDRLRIESPGGGGWGDPHERAPEAVAGDVRHGYLSPAAARESYLVIVDERGRLDRDATATLRGRR